MIYVLSHNFSLFLFTSIFFIQTNRKSSDKNRFSHFCFFSNRLFIFSNKSHIVDTVHQTFYDVKWKKMFEHYSLQSKFNLKLITYFIVTPKHSWPSCVVYFVLFTLLLPEWARFNIVKNISKINSVIRRKAYKTLLY